MGVENENISERVLRIDTDLGQARNCVCQCVCVCVCVCVCECVCVCV